MIEISTLHHQIHQSLERLVKFTILEDREFGYAKYGEVHLLMRVEKRVLIPSL